MASVATSRRVPWVALTLSFLAAGVGHVYCGRIAKGLVLYYAWFLVPLCVTIAALAPPTVASLVLLILLPIVAVVIVYWYAAIDAWRLARRMGSEFVLRDYNRALVYCLLIVVQLSYPIGLMAGLRSLVYEAFVVPASSMSPTILKGDRILARKLLARGRFPERGDLIVFRNPEPTGGTIFIKRVIAVAGDHVKIDGEELLINGEQVDRYRVPDESLKLFGEQVEGRVSHEVNSGHRYLVAYAGTHADEEFEAVIPDRHVFVLGDNRDRSRDSRYFGSIHIGSVIGYVDYVYWPSVSWSRFGAADGELP